MGLVLAIVVCRRLRICWVDKRRESAFYTQRLSLRVAQDIWLASGFPIVLWYIFSTSFSSLNSDAWVSRLHLVLVPGLQLTRYANITQRNADVSCTYSTVMLETWFDLIWFDLIILSYLPRKGYELSIINRISS
jgi:nitrogen fixation/metabolism regulation signal transduction histidine kinase